jgi:hypothetical protein
MPAGEIARGLAGASGDASGAVIPSPLVVTVALPRLTARRAATIEPTIQKLISKGRAIKHKPPSNSTVLSSMHATFRL